jgi:hypothetical protein
MNVSAEQTLLDEDERSRNRALDASESFIV